MGVSLWHSVSNAPSFLFYNPGIARFSQSIRSFRLRFFLLFSFRLRSLFHLFFPSSVGRSWWSSTKRESPEIMEPGRIVVACVEKINPVFSVDLPFHFFKIPTVSLIPHPLMVEVVVDELMNDDVHPCGSLVSVLDLDRHVSVLPRNSAGFSIERDESPEFDPKAILWNPESTCRRPQRGKPFNPFFGFNNHLDLWHLVIEAHLVDEVLNFAATVNLRPFLCSFFPKHNRPFCLSNIYTFRSN